MENLFNVSDLKYLNIINIDNLVFEKERPYVIFGKSGTGKTTFMKLLMGMYPNFSGDVFFDNKNIQELDSQFIRNNVMFVRDENIFIKETIEEEFIYFSELLKKKYDPDKVLSLLEEFQVNHKLNQIIVNLSTGEKQRLKLIRAFYFDYSHYILDEPTSSLDKDTVDLVLEIILKKVSREKKTVIMISHDRKIIDNSDIEKINFEEINGH